MARSQSFNGTKILPFPRRSRSLRVLPVRSTSHEFSETTSKVLTSRFNDPRKPSPHLPLEVIHQILKFAIKGFSLGGTNNPSSGDSSPSWDVGATTTGCAIGDFDYVRPFTLVSRSFQELALSIFFRKLHIADSRACGAVCKYLENQRGSPSAGLGWIRHLTISSNVFVSRPHPLHSLERLHSLCCDFHMETMVSQLVRIRIFLRSFNSPDTASLNSPRVAHLTSLTLTKLSTIHAPLLNSLALTFPTLQTLHLSCTERIDLGCCRGCYEESLTCVYHSPLPGLYPDTYALAKDFGSALSSLQELKYLSLGIFLSDETLAYDHVDRMDPPRISNLVDIRPECALCIESGVEIVERELLATKLIGACLPHLRSIRWSSFYTGNFVSKIKVWEAEERINGRNAYPSAQGPSSAWQKAEAMKAVVNIVRVGDTLIVRRR